MCFSYSSKMIIGYKQFGGKFPTCLSGKESTYTNVRDSGDVDSIPELEDPLEEEMAIHSSILDWKIPWTEELGGLQSTGLQRVGHN